MTHLLCLKTQCPIKPVNEFFHDRKDYINDSLFHQKQSATNRLLAVSRTNYAHGSPTEAMFFHFQ